MASGFSKFKKGIQLDPQSADPSNPAEGDQFYSDGTSRAKGMWQYKEGAWAEFGGSGSSGINYLSGDSSNAANGIGDWVTYADAAGENPVDGTAGTANITFTQNTTTPLRGTADFKLSKDAADRQGEGASVDFTVDVADKAKKLTISFDYDASSSNYADGDIRLSVYDVTNAQLIRINGEDLKAGKGTHYAQFQTASDSVSYRLIAHVSSTNATAYDLYFDNFSVGPTNLAFGAIMVDPIEITPTLKGTSSDPSTGTLTTNRFKYSRSGKYMVGNITLVQSTSGTDGTGGYYIELPNGLKWDSSLSVGTVVGSAYIVVNGTRFEGIATASGNSSDGISCTVGNSASALGGWNAVSHPLATGTYEVNISFMIEIEGWSSNAQMSEDLGGREISFHATRSADQTLSGSGTINFDTITYDTTGSYNASTYEFTVPESGKYMFNAGLEFSVTPSVGQVLAMDLEVNGSTNYRLFRYEFQATPGSVMQPTQTGSRILDLVKGDTVRAYFIETFAGTLTLVAATTGGSYFSGSKIASPQTMLETETVAARYTTSAGLGITATTQPIIFELLDFDTHNAYNTSTGVYIVPVSGKYDIRSRAVITSDLLFTTTIIQLHISKNGTPVDTSKYSAKVTGSMRHNFQIDSVLDLVKGDTIEIEMDQNSGATKSLDSTSTIYNVFSIARIK